ncbi:MAG TPA: hypothetical protein VG246_02500 [Acidimicrobiales bacterium]|nr:hypothetical protein [Acidimicrobiales bacterium]
MNAESRSFTPTWEEYLASAKRYLVAMRQSTESGLVPPAAPRRPVGPCPEELRNEAHRVRLGFDQLAVEVTHHLSTLEQRLATSPRSPFKTRGHALYLDTPV